MVSDFAIFFASAMVGTGVFGAVCMWLYSRSLDRKYGRGPGR